MLFAAMVAAWFLSPQLLYIERPATTADVIIILGGDAEGRVCGVKGSVPHIDIRGVSPIIEEPEWLKSK